MGRRGPRPQPSALKLERGNPGHRPINPEEPQLDPLEESDVPEVVRGNPAALAEWQRLAPELTAKGVLTSADRSTFAQYCLIVGEVAEYVELCGKLSAAQAHQLGYRSYLIKLRVQMRLFAAECGVTPSSRSSVRVAKHLGAADQKRRRFFGVGANRAE